MAYYYTTILTTSVAITTTKCVFISTCTHNVGLAVLLLMLWHTMYGIRPNAVLILVHFGAIEFASKKKYNLLDVKKATWIFTRNISVKVL